MNTTEIFQKLNKAGVLKYDINNYKGLLKEFAPELVEAYYKPRMGQVVYIWRDGADALYVGKSKNWLSRMTAHLVDMLAQRDGMYAHFFKAHEAGTLTVETIKCPDGKNLDELECETVVAHSNPNMYNVEYNPGVPKSKNLVLFTSIDELRGIISNYKCNVLAPAWLEDPVYLEMKDRLTDPGLTTPYGHCVHCAEQITFKKLYKHEPRCLHRHPQSVHDEIKEGAKTITSRAKYVKEMTEKHGTIAGQLKILLDF